MPEAGVDANLAGKKRPADMDQHDGDRRHCRRGHAVQHDAQLAMIRIGGGGMRVRHLHHAKQRQQHKAEHGRGDCK